MLAGALRGTLERALSLRSLERACNRIRDCQSYFASALDHRLAPTRAGVEANRGA